MRGERISYHSFWIQNSLWATFGCKVVLGVFNKIQEVSCKKVKKKCQELTELGFFLEKFELNTTNFYLHKTACYLAKNVYFLVLFFVNILFFIVQKNFKDHRQSGGHFFQGLFPPPHKILHFFYQKLQIRISLKL